ncbi:TetR/AcrR family transcriptional regulator [Acidisoma cladoniae]|jgi:AcrR family transcriptional regulator|uniref:TetR/AcrR family transcriptional regulator n=1 Tax=Acidisoma cladoniae TaxID=3040935 RepID=UPI00254A2E61|nr:TetR/AcrR family transcriptional regulator [Acidisoma sp. PAMC 29798]
MGLIRRCGQSRQSAASPVVAEPRVIMESRRRDHLLTAAEQVFLDRGYVSSTMDDIAHAAGMSKKTIYQVFSSKKDLFDALMMDRLSELKMPANDTDQSASAVLKDLLFRLGQMVLAPKHIAMARLIVAEVASSPEVADVLKARCTQGETTMQRWLADQTTRGIFVLPDVVEGANMLFAMALGDFHWHLLLGMGPRPSDEALHRRIDWAVGVFMREFGARAA